MGPAFLFKVGAGGCLKPGSKFSIIILEENDVRILS